MKCEIVMVGTELLLGQIVDSNAAFMGQVLAENGIGLFQKTTVGDNAERICRVLDAALDRADVVLVSGGLGPTEDDITRECVAQLLGRPLEFREDLYETLAARFQRMNVPMSENNRKQACVPRDAIAVANPNGTAPGLIVDDARGVIACMPGVPSELKPMLTDSIIPYLRERFGLPGVIHSRVLKVCGFGESRIDAAIADLIVNGANPTIGLLASLDATRIRITAHAETVDEANALIDALDAKVRERLPGLVLDACDDCVETAVDRLLAARGWTLAIAETVTGGMLAQRLTAAGAKTFTGGAVHGRAGTSDSSSCKRSGEEAARLAREAMKMFGASCGLGIVGNPEAHNCTVTFETPKGTVTWQLGYARTDERSQLRTAVVTFEHVRRWLMG